MTLETQKNPLDVYTSKNDYFRIRHVKLARIIVHRFGSIRRFERHKHFATYYNDYIIFASCNMYPYRSIDRKREEIWLWNFIWYRKLSFIWNVFCHKQYSHVFDFVLSFCIFFSSAPSHAKCSAYKHTRTQSRYYQFLAIRSTCRWYTFVHFLMCR